MYRRLLGLLSCLALTSAAGCGSPKPGADEPAALDEDTPVATDESGDETENTSAELADTIDRADLIPVLDAGPGAFLATVRVEPFFRDQRWAGWTVKSFDTRYDRAGLEPGDVVLEVNGKPIMRPEQLFELFKELRTADSLVVTGERNGAPMELRFRIEGAAPPAPAGEQK